MSQKELHYIVEVEIQSGGYEKHVRKLIKAETKDEAKREALRGQCHCDMRKGAQWLDKFTLEDCHGEFIYSITDCIRVHKDDVFTLRRYLIPYSDESQAPRKPLTPKQ